MVQNLAWVMNSKATAEQRAMVTTSECGTYLADRDADKIRRRRDALDAARQTPIHHLCRGEEAKNLQTAEERLIGCCSFISSPVAGWSRMIARLSARRYREGDTVLERVVRCMIPDCTLAC